MKQYFSTEVISNIEFNSVVSIDDNNKINFQTNITNSSLITNKKVSVYIGVYFKSILLNSFVMTEKIPCKFYSIFGNSNDKTSNVISNLNTNQLLMDEVIEYPINFSKFDEIKHIDSELVNELTNKQRTEEILHLKEKRLNTINHLRNKIKIQNILDNITVEIKHQVV